MREPVIVDVVRTTFGKSGGSLANWHPTDLLGFALTSLVERTGVDPERIDDVIGGCVSQVGEQGTNLSRNAWVAAGLPQSVPATTVDRQCGSSQQAVHFAAAGVAAGHYDLVIACGAEVMSRVGLGSNARGGTGPFSPSFLEHIQGRLWMQFRVSQVLADRYGITREDMDAFALESHRRAAESWDNGHFDKEAIPVPIKAEDGTLTGEFLRTDEGIRRGSTLEKLAALAVGARHGARHHGRKFVPDHRRGGGHAHRGTLGGRGTGSAHPGPFRPLRRGGRRCRHRPVGPGPGHPETARPLRHEGGRVRRRRMQRSLCGHRPHVAHRLRLRSGPPQPPGRCHRHRAPVGSQRRALDGNPAESSGGDPGPLRLPDHVRGGRPGQRHRD